MKIVHVPSPVLLRGVRPVSLSSSTKGRNDSPNSPLDKRTLRIVHDMIETLKSARNPEGVGLAANQVGLPLAIFVMMPKKNAEVIVCINPKILAIEGDRSIRVEGSREERDSAHADNTSEHPSRANEPLKKNEQLEINEQLHKNEQGLEGCLSIPQIWGEVDRAERVHLSFVDLMGERIERWFKGFEAIIVQHEMDHLNGIVFTQRALEQGHELVKEIGGGEFERYEI